MKQKKNAANNKNSIAELLHIENVNTISLVKLLKA